MVAIGVIAGTAEEDVRRPRAARAARVGVVARGAVAPEVACRAIARVAERRGALPAVAQRRLADRAARPRGGREARAALDRPVGLDADREVAGPAAARMRRAPLAAQERLVRPEVADVVAGDELEAELPRAADEVSEARKERQEVVRLQEHVGLRRRRDHRLEVVNWILPASRAGLRRCARGSPAARARKRRLICVLQA